MIEIHDRKCQGSQMAINIRRHSYFFRCWLLCGYYSRAATIRGQLLFESGVYFFEKPVDINNGWIRYVWVRRWRLLDTVSSKHSLSVLLSAVETTRTTWIAQALAWWLSLEIIRTRVPRILLAMATIRGRCLFLLELQIVWLLFEGDAYLKKYGS